MSKCLSAVPRRHRARPAFLSLPESTPSDALSESSEGSRDSLEESSDDASSGPSDFRSQRPLFAFGYQGPVFYFGTAINPKSSDQVPRGWKGKHKKVSRGDEGHNACPKTTQITATGRIRNSRVGFAPLPSHHSRSSQPPLFTFLHHLEQEVPLFAPDTGAVKSRSPKRRTRFTGDSKSRDSRSPGSHRKAVFVCEGEGLESDDGQMLRNNMRSIRRGTRRPEILKSMELREQEPFPAFGQSKRDITIASRIGFSERHAKTGEGLNIVNGPVYMTGGADGGEGLRHFDEMNDWWERELLNQKEPQSPNFRHKVDSARQSSTTAPVKPILKTSRSSITNSKTPANSNQVHFVDNEGKLYWTLDN